MSPARKEHLSTRTYSIRSATVADAPAIASLLEQLTQAEGSPRNIDAALLGAALAGEGMPVRLYALVAEASAKLLGVILFYPGYDVLTATYGMHLADFVVEESQRGRGIGRQLYAALAARVLETGAEWVSLTVLKENARAQQFYRAAGMRDVPVDFFAIGKSGVVSATHLLQK